MSSFAGSLDANVILRLLLNDIPLQHKKARDLLNSSKNQFAVADTALLEVAFVLGRAYNFTHEQIAESIDGFMSLKQINCNRIMFDKALAQFVKSIGLSLEDCALSAYADINNAKPLFTFDKKLANQSPSAKLLT